MAKYSVNKTVFRRFLPVFVSTVILSISCAPPPSSPQKRSIRDDGKVSEAAATASVPRGFVLLFSGNWLGHLEPCGCTEVQLGGIDRRTQTIQKLAPCQSARLLLEAGPIVEKQDRQGQLKLETFLQSLGELNYNGISLTPDELVMLHDDLSGPADQYGPIICSNMPAEIREKFSVRKSLAGTLQYEEHKLDYLVFALWDLEQLTNARLTDRLKPLDPLTALKDSLADAGVTPDQPSNDKLVIVALSVMNGTLVEELRRLPALDILLIRGVADEPEQYPQSSPGPLVITTGQMGKHITRIELAFNTPDNPDNFTFSYIAIDSDFPQDPAVVAIIEDYQELLRIENLIEREGALVRHPLLSGNSFVGSSVCATCHQSTYLHWEESKHAKAMETLQRMGRDFDPECVVCHSVGMKYEGGYRSVEKTPDLADVGCEMCHGPASHHVTNPMDEYRGTFTSCEQCHDHENSPHFETERDEYFNKIRHWTEPD